MAKDNKVSMPSGMGGIVRYFDETKSNIQLKPGHVIIFIVAVIVILLFLHVFY